MEHVLGELVDRMEGALSEERARAVDAHLRACASCRLAADELEEVRGFLALLSPLDTPSTEVRARVLAAVDRDRLARFAGHVAALFSIGLPEARALLEGLVDAAWEPSMLPGAEHQLVAFVPPTQLKFFIRVPAGVQVPWHEHHGQEETLILSGGLRDDTGRLWRPGEQMPKETGSRHCFWADGEEDLLCAVRCDDGVTVVDA